MSSGKLCSRQPKKKTLSQPTMRAEISLIRALISNCHTERIMGSYEKHFGGGGEYVNSQSETHQTLSTVANPLPIKQIKSNREKKKKIENRIHYETQSEGI